MGSNISLQLLFAWIGRVSTGIVFCLTAYLLYTECTKKIWLSTDDESNRKKRIYKRTLNISSITLQIVINLALFGLFLSCCPIPCTYTVRPWAMFFVLAKLGLTFWQILRLQYSSCIYRLYSPCLFHILYTCGAGLLCYTSFIAMGAFGYQEPTYNGYQCTMPSQDSNVLLAQIYLLWYLLWDLGVLALYIYKIRKLTKHATDNPSTRTVQMGLRKIVILTIIYECVAFLASFTFMVSSDSVFGQIFIETKCGQSIDFLFVSLCLYFMVDHNNEKYIKVVALCKCKRNDDKREHENEAQTDHELSSLTAAQVNSNTNTLTSTRNLKSCAKTSNALTVRMDTATTKESTSTCHTASGVPELVARVSLLD